MTAPRTIEWVLPVSAFPRPPVAGDYFASGKGRTALAVSIVRKVLAARIGDSYRLIGMRVRLADLPPGITPLPCPKRQPKVGHKPANEIPTIPRPIALAAVQAKERRRHAVALLKDDAQHDRLVHPVRVANGTAISHEWRDPDDVSTVRRTARVIRGYRKNDVVEALLEIGTLGKGQARAAKRFRKLYELGAIGLTGGRDLGAAPGGFASGTGPSESRSLYLEAYRQASVALGSSLSIVLAVVIHENTITSYADRMRMNRGVAVGYFLSSIDRLVDYFKKLDDAAKDEAQQPT